MFITFEGVEGSGKSTQAEKLSTYLQEQGYRVVLTREPGGTALSDKIRDMLLDPQNKDMTDRTEVLLYMASRAQHTKQFIMPNINKGNIVICDRYIDSSVAYQGWARNIGVENIHWLNIFSTRNIKPDITFIIDLDPEIGLQRVGKDKDRIESESLVFHKRVREGYLQIFENNPERVKLINGNQDIEEIFEKIKSIILPVIKEKYYEKP